MTEQTPSVNPHGITKMTISGKFELDTALSMRYADTLSDAVTANLTSPQAIALIQKHLKDKNPEELHAGLIKPLADEIPESFLNIVRETVFYSGAAVKELVCEMELEVGQPFRLMGPRRLGALVVRDGLLTDINLASQL